LPGPEPHQNEASPRFLVLLSIMREGAICVFV
jgi:hypothetical protein